MISDRNLFESDPKIAELIRKETERKEYSLEMIASENCVSEAVLEACGSIMTDKYCEGYPGKRYYRGCGYYDEVEQLAIDRAKAMFGMDEANVQPHSGSNANLAATLALIAPGEKILGPRLDHGGHLTHGSKVNYSGRYFVAEGYGVNPETGLYEEDEVMQIAKKFQPKLVICGASAYSRQIDFAMFRRVADSVGAFLLADVAHYAGLIVGGAYQSPVAYADLVTTTTHKTLRGPRGGIILCGTKYIQQVNKMVFPGVQGGPLMHQIAGKAVAFGEALQPEFKLYAHRVVENARRLAAQLVKHGLKILSGGTDSHMLVLDLRGTEFTGKQVDEVLERVGITANKNTVPNDPNPPTVTSGVRLGTAALTTRGFGLEDMDVVADFILAAMQAGNDESKLKSIREDVRSFCTKKPLYANRLK